MRFLPEAVLLIAAVVAFSGFGMLACASPTPTTADTSTGSRAQRPSPRLSPDAVVIEGEIAPGDTYLTPNVKDRDGMPAYVHVSPEDMPLRISIGLPKDPPRYGSRADGRRAAIEAMQEWEAAIAPHLRWFRLEFVDDDPDAAVQVKWKRRINGPWGGFGGISYSLPGGLLRVGGEMQVSTTPTGDKGLEVRVTMDQLRVLFAHEFGHVLGLGHCFECDSAMNYSFDTLGRIVVTEQDVRAFIALVQQPNGQRIDGRLLSTIPGDAMPDD